MSKFRYKKIFLSAIFFAICSLTSCMSGDKPYYSDFNSISNAEWSAFNKLQFDVPINEKGKYDIVLLVRNNNKYKYSNLYTKVDVLNPNDSIVYAKLVEVKLAEKTGEWLGEGSTSNLFLKRDTVMLNYDVTDVGVYKFSVEHYMRENPLLNITDIGLEINKSK